MSTQEPTKPTQAGTQSNMPTSGRGQTVEPGAANEISGTRTSNPKLPSHGDKGDPRRLDVEAGKGNPAAAKPAASAHSVNPAKKA